MGRAARKGSGVKDPGYLPERAWRDADGTDLEQDTRWDEVDPGMFGPDPSLDDWPRPGRTLVKSPVVREDFDPAGPPELPPTPGLTRPERTTPALPFAASTLAQPAAGPSGRRRAPSPF